MGPVRHSQGPQGREAPQCWSNNQIGCQRMTGGAVIRNRTWPQRHPPTQGRLLTSIIPSLNAGRHPPVRLEKYN
jgi:hypothetical protein